MQIHETTSDMKQTGRPPLPKAERKETGLYVRFKRQDVKKLESLSKKMNSSKVEVLRTLLAQA